MNPHDPHSESAAPPWHSDFEALLPTVRRCALLRLHAFGGEALEEALAEVSPGGSKPFLTLHVHSADPRRPPRRPA